MIYIVDVLARILTLAASLFSMIALEKKKKQCLGAWLEKKTLQTWKQRN